MQIIGPCLWFESQAEAAAAFYTSIFKNSRILHTARFPEGAPGPTGSVMTVQFLLDGQEFLALNGGPQFSFSEAVSFMVSCDTQEEVDYLWEKLTAGGEESQCGWLKDRFGLSWQILPAGFLKRMRDPDTAAVKRMVAAMLKMKKLDGAVLERAFRNG